MHSGASHIPATIERSLIRLVAWLSGFAATAYLAVGWYSGEFALVVGATGPLLVSIIGIVFLRLGYDRILPLLCLTAVVIVVEDWLLDIEGISHGAVVPLAVVVITGAFFVPRRFAGLFVAAAVVIVFASRLRLFGDSVELLQATIAAGSVAFGALLLSWTRRELEQREERYHSLFQHAPISLWREDFSAVGVALDALKADGVPNIEKYLQSNPEEVRRLAALIRVIDVNDAAVRLTEAPDRDLLLGRFRMDTFSQGALNSFVSQFMAIADDRERVSTEMEGGLTMTGQPIEALVVWSAPRAAGDLDLANVTVAIVDITLQREAERKLRNLIESKDQFVATISHELRTPLTAVVGIAEELRDQGNSIDETERAELLGLVAEQSLEVSRIVDDLLVVARADAGNLIVAARPFDLAEEVTRVTQSFDPGIAVETIGSPTVVADPQRVRQIVRNLLTNAQRYGGPHIRVVVGDEGSRGIVEVRDDGAAIDALSRTEIFEPYTRAKQRPGVTASVGLGLTVSRRLARHMGGDLTYDHDSGETVFALTLATSDRAVAVS